MSVCSFIEVRLMDSELWANTSQKCLSVLQLFCTSVVMLDFENQQYWHVSFIRFVQSFILNSELWAIMFFHCIPCCCFVLRRCHSYALERDYYNLIFRCINQIECQIIKNQIKCMYKTLAEYHLSNWPIAIMMSQ